MRNRLAAAAVILLILGGIYTAYRYGASRGVSEMPLPEEAMEASRILPQTRQVDLYFADAGGRRLSIERREVTGENREDLLRKVLEELVK